MKYIRYIILIGSILAAILVWVIGLKIYPNFFYVEIAEIYAILALSFLYASLLVTPLYFNFKRLPWKPLAIRARRAMGVSAFMFAALHASTMFFGYYGGFKILSYIATSYLIAFAAAAIALFILALMAATSFDAVVSRMGKSWKTLHRFVYLAALLIVLHVMIVSPDPIFSILFALLFALEMFRFDEYIVRKFPKVPRYLTAGILILLMFAGFILQFIYQGH